MARVYVLPDQKLVESHEGEDVLDSALRAGIDWAHACGGFAQCSTCRLVVLEGLGSCAERTSKERAIADRLHFGEEFRLACQLRVTGDVTVRRLVVDDRDLRLADVRTTIARVSLPYWLKRVLDPLFGRLLRRRARRRPIGTEQSIAVMFADIRGFTPFAEAVLPYDVIHVLGRHLRDMTHLVETHEGRVTSYMGDGIMAIFGVDGRPAPVLNAVRAALAMVAHVEEGAARMRELYGRTFELNVGVHFGPAIVGTLWGDAASVTAIGDAVNVAARIEQANKEASTRVLVSTSAFQEIEAVAVAGRRISCELSGKSERHELVEVVDLKGDVVRG